MENIVSSKPLYEKIIVDRKNGQVHGYTFENLSDEKYSEHFVYQRTDQHVNYDMFLFRNPGLKRLLRHRMHSWGVQMLEKIMTAQELLKQKKEAARLLLLEKKEVVKEKAVMKIEKVKRAVSRDRAS